jgi:hypothetical protein
MAAPRNLHPIDAIALKYFGDLVSAGAGYERRGVRGWARLEDAQTATGHSLAVRVLGMYGRGLLQRDNVRPPGHVRPLWVYRITQAGADVVSHAEGDHRARVPTPSDATDASVYVPDGPRLALRALRRILEERVPCRWAPEEAGWIPAAELRRRAEPTPAAWWFPEDLGWLVRAGLAERREVTTPGQSAPVILYRASAGGGVAPVLEWHESRSG